MKKGSHKGEIRTEINITSVDEKPISKMFEWIENIGYKEFKKKEKYRDTYHIRINTQNDIIKFLELILPYLLTRRKQAELMLKYCKSRLSKKRILVDYYKNGRLYRIPQKPSYDDEEERLIYELSQLNY